MSAKDTSRDERPLLNTLSVRGQAVARATPDEARVSFTLLYTGRTPQDAFTEVARRAERLAALFDARSIERSRWNTAGVTVNEKREYEKERWVHRGYEATTTVQLRVSDSGVLGDLMAQAVAQSEAQVAGPVWSVTDDNPARFEACRRAAENARQKAEAYASGLGVQLGSILHIAEPGIQPVSLARPKMMMARAVMQEDAAPDMPIEAGEMDVRATVEVTFGLADASS